ncbi:MAG: TolB family protein [Actinomycetota bacterium]|jgi:Tol biopolymer transport system component
MKTVFLLMVLFFSAEVYPQDIKVRSVKRVTPEDSGSYLLTGVVPGSEYLLVAGGGYNGLSLLDIRRETLKPVTDEPGAGYEPAVTADGNKIIYRSDSYSDNMKYSSVTTFDVTTGEKKKLVEKGRDVLTPAVAGNKIFVKSEGGMKIEQAGPEMKSAGNVLFLVIEEMMPVLYREGERKALMPNGDGFYIWASLSPDGTMILYNYQGRGTYICDLTGNILHDLGRINAPKWFNDRLVIGMDDKDDGHRITSSELVYYSLGDRKRVVFTSTPERSEMFPFALGNRRIAFCTDNGEIFVMKVRVR